MAKKDKDKKTMTEKEKAQLKLQKKRSRRKVYNTIMGIIVFCTLLGVASGVSTIALILSKSDVELNVSDLESTEVSIIYDDSGNEIARLGSEDRINVDYEDLPQCVIDAFVSVEDSRYFEHSGFDLPRFAKAFLENIQTLSFSQGGSTITMQVIKNTYFAVDTVAEKSINRKVQEIYYAIKVNTLVSKETIFELYVNKINYGASARGIQVACEYYFGKDVTEITLVEAAMLAGIVNAPNAYNPYYYPTACQERTAEVLYLMNYHGYITDEEYELALQVNVVDLLVGTTEVNYDEGETISNQAYIDTVITELEDVYGIDVYSDAVRVYTGMNQTIQSYLDSVSDGEVVSFKDQYMNYANAVVENGTGLIVGLCGGRSYSTVRGYNYATDARLQPGSTVKAIISYPLAFEYVGISTGHYETIEPIYLDGSTIIVSEDTGNYYGEISIQRSFPNSYNVAAIKLLRKVRAAIGDDAVISYLKAIGFDEDVADNFNEQFAIGGYDCLISPLQLAAAGSVMLSGGYYTTPHTITKIEYISDSKEDVTVSWTSTQVLSEGAAYLTAYMMRIAVNRSLATSADAGRNSRISKFNYSYPVYAKTGTTSLPESIQEAYNMPNSGAQSQWLIVATKKFTIGSWIGYDYSKGVYSGAYISTSDRSAARDGTIMTGLLQRLESVYGADYEELTQPSSVVSITHIKALYPYTEMPSYGDKNLTITGMILSQYATLETWTTEPISNPTSISTTITRNSDSTATITITTDEYPDSSWTTSPGTYSTINSLLKMTVGSKTYTGTLTYDKTWIDGIIQTHYVISDSDGNLLVDYATTDTSYSYTVTIPDIYENTTYYTSVYYQYSIAGVASVRLEDAVSLEGLTYTETDTNTDTEVGDTIIE